MEKLRLNGNWDSTRQVSTNNAWGFGGWVGTEYHIGNIMVKVGRLYYRHMPSTPYLSIDGLPSEILPISEADAIKYVNSLI